jgi:hypothetical protein
LYGADDLARPIRLFGIVLIILSVLSLGVFVYWLALAQFVQTGYLPVLMLLGVDVLVFSTGLGVATSKKWGFRLFRVFLYVMLFAFPLGTMVSYVTLRYISRNQIQQYYGLPVEARDSPRAVSVAWLLVGIGAMIALYLWMLLSF